MYSRLWCVEELHVALSLNEGPQEEHVELHMLASQNYLERYIDWGAGRIYTEDELKNRSDPTTPNGVPRLTLQTKTIDAT